jgi:hypothetical protein
LVILQENFNACKERADAQKHLKNGHHPMAQLPVPNLKKTAPAVLLT